MENQKAEAVLNLAADATAEELKKAEELSLSLIHISEPTRRS